jgi:phosphate:Na+ symporter
VSKVAEFSMFLVFLGIFLVGMYVLRLGLFQISGKTLASFLAKLTNKPWKGFGAGIFFTGLLQSSSAVMVMTVGFVSVGMMTFPQTIGIILGANIGSTFITEFMAFSLDRMILPGILVGALLCLFRNRFMNSLGTSLIGLSAIFAAMSGFKRLSDPLASIPLVKIWLVMMDHHIFFAVLTGIVVTAVIHSSSATIGIAMSFLSGDDLSVTTAIAVMLGSNIGSCITGWMASIGSGKEAAFTAYAHIWLNVLGVLIFLPFTGILELAVVRLTSSKEMQLAHASLLFNVITSLVVLPFSRQFATFIVKVHDKK